MSQLSLTAAEIKTLCAAIESAIANEQELLACYTDRYTGKCWDRKVGARQRGFIGRMRRVRQKLADAKKARGR